MALSATDRAAVQGASLQGYFVMRGGRAQGPYSLEALRIWSMKGRIRTGEPVSSDGQHWRPAETFPELGRIQPQPLSALSLGLREVSLPRRIEIEQIAEMNRIKNTAGLFHGKPAPPRIPMPTAIRSTAGELTLSTQGHSNARRQAHAVAALLKTAVRDHEHHPHPPVPAQRAPALGKANRRRSAARLHPHPHPLGTAREAPPGRPKNVSRQLIYWITNILRH